MRWRVPKIRPPQGRSRLGYGLPSLVVVLFFVSILVQVIVSGMARETQEAKAEAAFSITKENLDTFKITEDAPNSATMPHLAGGSRYVNIEVTHPVGLSPRMTPTFLDTDSRSKALFDQKLRSYVNVANTDFLGSLEAWEIRPEHPERVRRSGDRMATDLTSQNIFGIADLSTGTAVADDTEAGALIGIDTTLLDAETLEAPNLTASTLSLSGGIIADTLVANRSIVSNEIRVRNTTQVYSGIQSRLADIDEVAISGQIAADNGLDGIDDLNFNTLVADGLRAGGVYTATFAATNIVGQPNSGEFEGGNPVDDNGDDALTDLEQCMADGGSFYDCVWGNSGDDDTGGDDGSDDTGNDGDDDDSGDGSSSADPYDLCVEIGMSDELCSFYTGDFLTGETMPYSECIDGGGTPLFCEMISGGSGGALDGNGNPMTPYEQCLYEGGTTEICSLFPDYFDAAPDDVVVDTTYEECRAAGGDFTFCTQFPSVDDTCYAGLTCGTVVPTYEDCVAAGASAAYCAQFPEEYDGPTEYQCTVAGGTTSFCTVFPDSRGNCYTGDCDYSDLTYEDCLLNGEGTSFDAFCAQFPPEPEEPADDDLSREQCIVENGLNTACNEYPTASPDFDTCVQNYVLGGYWYPSVAVEQCSMMLVEYDSYEQCIGRGVSENICSRFPQETSEEELAAEYAECMEYYVNVDRQTPTMAQYICRNQVGWSP